MSELSSIERLEELEAGRVLGDLSGEEWREWESLSKAHPEALDGSLEWAAARLESSLASPSGENVPAGLKAKIHAGTAEFVTGSNRPSVVSVPWWNSAPIAWAAAASVTLLLVATLVFESGPGAGTAVKTPIEDRASDLVRSAFAGLGDYKGVRGNAVWSDELQEGYMSLENMPVNDPSVRQYQLWIVDPERDEAPVDGGVFDIGNDGIVRIPMDAKLRIDAPKAFVITLEQPGGVVKSKQEVVVALAEVS